MSLALRTLADGRICCSRTLPDGSAGLPEPHAMCDKCKDWYKQAPKRHATESQAARLRTAVPSDATPPDPYAAGLTQLRRELVAEEKAKPPVKLELDRNGVPDPYAAGLAKMRSDRQ